MKTRAPRRTGKTKPTPSSPAIPAECLLPVRPFPKRAVTSPETFHDIGTVTTPTEQAKAAPAAASPEQIEAAARQALRALAGTGPRQTPPHAGTALALGEALALLRDHALSGDAAAFNWLGYVLWNATADFHEVARRHPEAAAAWGEKQGFLPMLVPRKIARPSKKTTALHTELEATFDLFRLGEKCPVRVNPDGGRNPGAETPVNVLAAGLCRHLADHRAAFPILRPPIPRWARLAAELPELDRDHARAWGEAAWELLRASFAHDHELVTFCGLGKPRESESESGAGAQVSEIRRRLLRAIETIAPARP